MDSTQLERKGYLPASRLTSSFKKITEMLHRRISAEGIFFEDISPDNRGIDPKRKIMKTKTILFELLVDGVPYEVRATPFQFNDAVRYRVSYNGGPIFTFVYDLQIKHLIAIGDETGTIPDNLESAISQKLEGMSFVKTTS